MSNLLDKLAFHHIGVACRPDHAERERATLALLGYAPEGSEFVDPGLGIRGMFLVGPPPARPRLELCLPLDEHSPITHWLNSGVKMYHLAFETPALLDDIGRLRDARAKLVVEPTPAVAFQQRRVAFLMLPNLLLVELIEAAATPASSR